MPPFTVRTLGAHEDDDASDRAPSEEEDIPQDARTRRRSRQDSARRRVSSDTGEAQDGEDDEGEEASDREASDREPDKQPSGVGPSVPRRGGPLPAKAPQSVAAFYTTRASNQGRALAAAQAKATQEAHAFFNQVLSARKEHVQGGARERLAAVGAFVPYLLVNVSSHTTDALLYFNTMQVMALVATDTTPLTFARQESLLRFVEAVGVDGRVLHDLGSLPVSLSESSGEFLLRTHEYTQWLKFGKPIHVPEPLNSCFQHTVLSRAEIGDALGALVDLAAASAEGSLESSAAGLVFRLLYMLSAIARRFAKEPLDVGDIGKALLHILGLATPPLRAAAKALQSSQRQSAQTPVGPHKNWQKLHAALAEPLHQGTAAFLSSRASQDVLAHRRQDFVRIARAEVALRMLTVTALLFPLIGFVPEWLAAGGLAASLAALVSHPGLETSEDVEVAALMFLVAVDLGLDAELLGELATHAHVFSAGGKGDFANARRSLAERVRAKVWKTKSTHLAVEALRRKEGTEQLRMKAELLVQSLPAGSEGQKRMHVTASVAEMEAAKEIANLLGLTEEPALQALALLPGLEAAAAGGEGARVLRARTLSRKRSRSRSLSSAASVASTRVPSRSLSASAPAPRSRSASGGTRAPTRSRSRSLSSPASDGGRVPSRSRSASAGGPGARGVAESRSAPSRSRSQSAGPREGPASRRSGSRARSRSRSMSVAQASDAGPAGVRGGTRSRSASLAESEGAPSRSRSASAADSEDAE